MIEERPWRGSAECARQRLAPGFGDKDQMWLIEVAAEPGSPPLEVAAETSGGELLEEVLDEVLLRELLDDLNLLDADGHLARDRPAELDAGRALGHEETDQLAGRDERDGEAAASTSPRELGAELRKAES